MTITLQELSDLLENLLPMPQVPEYCPNGLQVEGKPQIRKIALAVSASVAAIEAAVKEGADVLIVHHGIFWNKDSYPISGVKKKKIALLIQNEISLFGYHLPLDAHPELGNNWKAALDLGWKNLQPFGGIGVRGQFAAVDVTTFQKQLEDYYQHPAAAALGGKSKISSAALISGGAYRSLELAARSGVDCFISGNFDEPAWHIAHEESINFFALGHHATERVGIIGLKEHLEKATGVPCVFLDLPNPF